MMDEHVKKLFVSEEASVLETIKAIDAGAFRVAFIVGDDDSLRGLVTDGDIRRALIRGIDLAVNISEVMNREPVVAYKDFNEAQLLSLMSERIRILPILNEQRQVVDYASYDQVYRIPVAEPVLGKKELEYVIDCIKTGWISSQGKYVRKFEEMMAEFCDVSHAVSASSGTTALHLALLALGIGQGDEIIVPDMTFIATANSAAYTGAKPVFVDVDRETWTMDIEKTRAAMNERTKAIIPVHIYGIPAMMDEIMEMAKGYGIFVVEDAAEAHGARYHGKKAGSIGEIGCFSFFGNKIVTTGEGGMAVTNNEEYAEEMRVLRDHGMSKTQKYVHTRLGYNYRLTNLQAAVGVAQMEKVWEILEKKRTIAEWYKNCLGNNKNLEMPPEPGYGNCVFWMFTPLLNSSCGRNASEVVELLGKRNIDARPFFLPLHRQPIYRQESSSGFEVSDDLFERGLCLPSSSNLHEEDVARICGYIDEILPS